MPSYGREITDITKWPWIVAIKINRQIDFSDDIRILMDSTLCTGTIIHPNYVLIAAHCVKSIVIIKL